MSVQCLPPGSSYIMKEEINCCVFLIPVTLERFLTLIVTSEAVGFVWMSKEHKTSLKVILKKKPFVKKKKTKTQIWSELSVFDQCVNLPVIHIGVVAFFTSCKFCGHLRQREHWNRTVATYSFWSNLSLVFSHQHQDCLLFFNYMCRTSRTTRVCESFCLL